MAHTLICGFAGRGRRDEWEPAVGPGVVELEEAPVAVLSDQSVKGREVGVRPVGGDADQSGGEQTGAEQGTGDVPAARAGRDQLRTSPDVLIDVTPLVGVPRYERVARAEEGPSIVGHERPVAAGPHIARRRRAIGPARYAQDFIGAGGVSVHLGQMGVVIRGDLVRGDEGHLTVAWG